MARAGAARLSELATTPGNTATAQLAAHIGIQDTSAAPLPARPSPPPAWWAGSRTHASSSRSPRSGSSSDSRRPWRPRPSCATSSPDSRPPRRSGRQDEVRARQPVELREHHHHSTRTSGHHRTPALPDGLRVPERLLRRIHCGEYIDFSDLLQENMYPSLAPGVAQQALQVQRTEGGGLELAMRSQTKRKVSDFPSWLEAFFRYLAAVTMYEPYRLGELLAYADIIRGFAVAYHPAQWLGYDAQFRSEAARNLDKRWDSIQSQIWATHLVTPFCAKCLQRGTPPQIVFGGPAATRIRQRLADQALSFGLLPPEPSEESFHTPLMARRCVSSSTAGRAMGAAASPTSVISAWAGTRPQGASARTRGRNHQPQPCPAQDQTMQLRGQRSHPAPHGPNFALSEAASAPAVPGQRPAPAVLGQRPPPAASRKPAPNFIIRDCVSTHDLLPQYQLSVPAYNMLSVHDNSHAPRHDT